MENLFFRDSVSLFMTMVVIVLLPRRTLSATSTYSRPEKFYVNCGSDSNITYGGRTFVGDMISGGNSVSLNRDGTEASNQSGPGIYGTVRIFRRPSSYKFQLDSVGLHFVRLHFSAVSSQTELLTARFTVSATSGSRHHFKSFSVQKFNETPRVEEFLLMIGSPKLEIRFAPDRSSIALVNAIEVFSARNDLEIPSESDKNLHTIYRINVGGGKITPDNDTLGRTWSLDNDFLYRKDSTMNRSSSERVGMLMNVTWSFKVKSNTKHFIRVHFCDIKNESQSSDSDFYLYVNGHWREDVKPSDHVRLVTPFYKDVVNVFDGSGLLNVSIGTKDPNKDAGFLNGIEVMEFLKKPGSDSSDKSSSRVYIITGCVAAGSILVLSLLFIVFFKRRRSKKKKPDAEASLWSPLPLYRGGSSHNRPFDPVKFLAGYGRYQNWRKIPSLICELCSLHTFDLSNNNFSGSIPLCMGNLKGNLSVLNLRQNRLSGGLPRNVFESLRSLDVGHNQLVGKLPTSSMNFSTLEVLNVESNIINDTFPFWLSSLQKLQVLVLRSNAFHGPIHQASFFTLKIIDISHNHFNGTLPSDYFVGWSNMSSLGTNEDRMSISYMGDYYYHDSMVLMNKGTAMELKSILTIYTALDFSRNRFEGEIPRSVGLLQELHVLNLSSNAFTGQIPSSMGNITALESLDVSQNKLSGEIPQELGNISSLAYMNFSHNELVGLVPGGTQFRTQNCSSFENNSGLLGPALDEVCRVVHTPSSQQHETPETEEEDEEVFSRIAAAIGLVPGTAFGSAIGYILVSYKPEWFTSPFGRNKRRSRRSTPSH